MLTTVLLFWFDELEPANWWQKDPNLDQRIRQRFGDLHQQAIAGELAEWRDSAEGRLAEIIVLDQFSRNIYRDDARAFAADGMALILAQEAVRGGYDAALSVSHKCFLYMPFMHSESALIQQQSIQLFATPGLEENRRFAEQHKAIIDRFGRYPHRNSVLQRASTPAECAFLTEPDSRF